MQNLTVIDGDSKDDGEKINLVSDIIAAYSGAIRLYAFVRFKIIHLRFLQEIEQYLPDHGTILDLGCGFGLFSLYMAARKPHAQFIGVDINAQRLAIARAAAQKLGIRNVTYEQADLRGWHPARALAGAYALDVFHHIPIESGDQLLRDLFARLEPRGRFLLKDIDTTPRAMLLFTYLLDVVMSPRDQFNYRSAEVWRRQMRVTGFAPVYVHDLWDLLPYPHVLLIGEKPAGEAHDAESIFNAPA